MRSGEQQVSSRFGHFQFSISTACLHGQNHSEPWVAQPAWVGHSWVIVGKGKGKKRKKKKKEKKKGGGGGKNEKEPGSAC